MHVTCRVTTQTVRQTEKYAPSPTLQSADLHQTRAHDKERRLSTLDPHRSVRAKPRRPTRVRCAHTCASAPLSLGPPLLPTPARGELRSRHRARRPRRLGDQGRTSATPSTSCCSCSGGTLATWLGLGLGLGLGVRVDARAARSPPAAPRRARRARGAPPPRAPRASAARGTSAGARWRAARTAPWSRSRGRAPPG